MSNDIIVSLPGYPFRNLPAATNIAVLRGVDVSAVADGSNISVNYGVTPGDQDGGLYAWSASSTANDDGAAVIRPDMISPLQAGRWTVVVSGASTAALAEALDQVSADLAAPGGAALVGQFDGGTVQSTLNLLKGVQSAPAVQATFVGDGSQALYGAYLNLAGTSLTKNEIGFGFNLTNNVAAGGGKAYVVGMFGSLTSALSSATGYTFNLIWNSTDVPGCVSELNNNFYGSTTYGAAYGESTVNSVSVWRTGQQIIGGAQGSGAQKAMSAYHCENAAPVGDQFYRGYTARGCSLVGFQDSSNSSISFYVEGTHAACIDMSPATISSGNAIRMPNNTGLAWKNTSGTLVQGVTWTSADELRLGYFAARTVIGSSMVPGVDNAFTWGSSTLAPSNIYSHNALIVVSDATKKTDAEVISEDFALSLIDTIQPRSYRFIVGGKTERIEKVSARVPKMDGDEHVVTYEPVVDTDGRAVMREVPDFGDDPFVDVRDEKTGAVNRMLKRWAPGMATKMVAEMKAVPVMVDGEVEKTVYDDREGVRRHLGFFAQDFEDAFKDKGVDYAAFVQMEDGTKALRYEEILPILWKAVQSLSMRLKVLEGK